MPKILPILIAPDVILKTESRPVDRIDDRVRELLDNMVATMYDAPGIGLAANQIGVTERLIVVDASRDPENRNPLKMINPEVVWESEQLTVHEEGCLSIPDYYAEVIRPKEIKVKYLDETGGEHEMHADDLWSRCIQHEIDHLDGVLFIDHLSSLKRNMALRKMEKIKKLSEIM
jgi:peptide deformylase